MNKHIRTIYLLSGPAGVGKSTTAIALSKTLKNSAYISGDDISHMHIGGRRKPWECAEELSLIWENIIAIALNFIKYGNDAVIDYIIFPDEAAWIYNKLIGLDVQVAYVVLWTDSQTLLERDSLRIPEHRMEERCLILLDEFKQSGLKDNHILVTSEYKMTQLQEIINEIVENDRFRLK